MPSIVMTESEVDGYRLAVALDEQWSADSPTTPFESANYAETILRSRSIIGIPDKITVSFCGGGRMPNVYELHYTQKDQK